MVLFLVWLQIWLPAGVCGAETIRGGGGIMVKWYKKSATICDR